MDMTTPESFKGTIEPITKAEIMPLTFELQRWIMEREQRYPFAGEVENIMDKVAAIFYGGSTNQYLLAKDEDDEMLGFIGIQPYLSDDLAEYKNELPTAEMIFSYLAPEASDIVALRLFNSAKELASEKGFKQFVVRKPKRISTDTEGEANLVEALNDAPIMIFML